MNGIKSQLSAALEDSMEYSRNGWQLIYVAVYWIFLEYSARLPVLLGPGLICRLFQDNSRNYFINQSLLMGRIFDGIFLCMQLFVIFLFHFIVEYPWNIPLKMEQTPPKKLREEGHFIDHLIWIPMTPTHGENNNATMWAISIAMMGAASLRKDTIHFRCSCIAKTHDGLNGSGWK